MKHKKLLPVILCLIVAVFLVSPLTLTEAHAAEADHAFSSGSISETITIYYGNGGSHSISREFTPEEYEDFIRDPAYNATGLTTSFLTDESGMPYVLVERSVNFHSDAELVDYILNGGSMLRFNDFILERNPEKESLFVNYLLSFSSDDELERDFLARYDSYYLAVKMPGNLQDYTATPYTEITGEKGTTVLVNILQVSKEHGGYGFSIQSSEYYSELGSDFSVCTLVLLLFLFIFVAITVLGGILVVMITGTVLLIVVIALVAKKRKAKKQKSVAPNAEASPEAPVVTNPPVEKALVEEVPAEPAESPVEEANASDAESTVSPTEHDTP